MSSRSLPWRTLAAGLASLAMILPAAAVAQSIAFAGPTFRFAAASSVLAGGLTAKATDGTGAPMAGATVTFTAPTTGPSFVFSNAATTMTATTDTSGFAHVDLVANAVPGVAVITASLAGATDATTEIAVTGPVTLEANWLREANAGSLVDLSGTIHLPWLDCSYEARAATQLTGVAATATANGVQLPGVSVTFPSTCPAGGDVRIVVVAQADKLVPDDYAIDLLVGLPYDMGFVEARASLRIKAPVRVTAASGDVLDVALYPPHGHFKDDCKALQAAAGRPGDAGWPASGPAGFDLPFGLLRLDATGCVTGNDIGAPKGPLALPLLIGTPAGLPDGAALWAFGPTADDATAHWYSLGATRSGRFARALLTDGGAGDNATKPDLELHATVAVAIARNGMAAGALQDLWWGGAPESGWGLSLTQHGSKLFGGLFIYDAGGNATWLVMPDGAWDASGNVFQGALYRPHGTRYDAYRAADLVVGPPVGSLRLTVVSLSSLTLDYVIDGIAGRKVLQRQRFGAPDMFVNAVNLADLWWGGPEQNGWGFALAQQASTLFGVYFTYDSNGNPTWFVAPAATVTKPTSKLYRTHGSPWIGASYNAAALSVLEVGQVTYKMGPDGGPLEMTIEGQPVFRDVTRQGF